MTVATVQKLKDQGEDFEWYPTTDAMINVIKTDMLNHFHDYDGPYDRKIKVPVPVNVLDCGAGDGRVVSELANGGKKYAIEKSPTLIDLMPEDIFMIGTEFFQSTLIDKKVKILFSNPPYSEFIQWAEKIILEANASMIYLILPTRWQGSESIKEALKLRDAECKIIHTTNFMNAERSARATVDILSIQLFQSRYGNRHDILYTDPFDIWFEQTFQFEADKEKRGEHEKESARKTTLKDRLDKQLTTGKSLVPALVELYNHEMNHMQKMFISISGLDADILKELNVNVKDLKESLQQRINGLKNRYWKELFDNYERITKRLTHASRETILNTLTANTSIDFTESNVYAVTIWVIKNANKYFDTQLIDLVEKMVDKANITLYKSNKRLYSDQDWRCRWGSRRTPENLRDFGLELRIVLHNIGGISGGYSWENQNGLNSRAHRFLDDLAAVAGNLGFALPSWVNSRQLVDEWQSNKKVEFYMNRAEKKMLMQVKAFKNGNLHIKFNQDFIRMLNVEFGRLKGWLTNHIQASEELNIPVEFAEKSFKGNFHLPAGTGLLLLGM